MRASHFPWSPVLAISLAACQDYGLGGDAEGVDSVGLPAAPRVVLRVVAEGHFVGLWTDGVVDRSRRCYADTAEGTDYRACCPQGFTPVGYTNDDDASANERFSVACLEDAPGTGRAVVYVSGAGTWIDGVRSSTECATYGFDDRLLGDPDVVEDLPDDYSACCPEGFDAVGYAKRQNYTDVTCLERVGPGAG